MYVQVYVGLVDGGTRKGEITGFVAFLNCVTIPYLR